jgi:hypothetical protein
VPHLRRRHRHRRRNPRLSPPPQRHRPLCPQVARVTITTSADTKITGKDVNKKEMLRQNFQLSK